METGVVKAGRRSGRGRRRSTGGLLCLGRCARSTATISRRARFDNTNFAPVRDDRRRMEARTETRDDYPHVRRIPTRWADNDVFGHVNNVVYYALFDTVINTWLIEEGGLDIHDGEIF